MCNPLAAVAALATVAGTVMSSQGQAQARDAQTHAVQNEVQLQANHQQQENAAFQNSLDQSQPANVQQNQKAATDARLAAEAQQGGMAGVDFLPGQDAGTTNATKNAIKQASDTATGQLTRQAQGSAALGGTNDAFHALSIGEQPNAEKIAIQSNFGQGDASLLPLQLVAASRQGSGLRSFGSLFTGLGMAGLGAAGGAALAGAGGSALGALGDGASTAGATEFSTVPAAAADDFATATGGGSSIWNNLGGAVSKAGAYMRKPFGS